MTAAARAFLDPFLDADGALGPDIDALTRLVGAALGAPAELRISRHLGPWVERARRLASQEAARKALLASAHAGGAGFDVVKLPLLPYQREGAAHLACHERALLADEMGLGKTVQAIAACEILAREKGISRVLVVSPTSVKAEWEEQIARFTDRTARFVAGPYPERMKLYQDHAPAFFSPWSNDRPGSQPRKWSGCSISARSPVLVSQFRSARVRVRGENVPGGESGKPAEISLRLSGGDARDRLVEPPPSRGLDFRGALDRQANDSRRVEMVDSHRDAERGMNAWATAPASARKPCVRA